MAARPVALLEGVRRSAMSPRGLAQCQTLGHVLAGGGYDRGMADAASLDERLEQIGAQLDWVRDYL